MLSRYNYKTRFLIMIGLTALVLVVGYFFSFKKTIFLVSEVRQLEGIGVEEEALIIAKIKNLSKQKSKIDSLKRTQELNSSSFVFADLVNIADYFNLKVDKIEGDGSQETESFTCIFEGLYINMVKLTAHMEKEFKSFRIESLEYSGVEDRRTGKRTLQMKMILSSNEF